MDAAAPAKQTTAAQPQAVQMSMMSPGAPANKQQCEHKASRIRGGGAAKDCFMSAIDCFLCFEGCKVCCDCFADIICCPCEMCC